MYVVNDTEETGLATSALTRWRVEFNCNYHHAMALMEKLWDAVRNPQSPFIVFLAENTPPECDLKRIYSAFAVWANQGLPAMSKFHSRTVRNNDPDELSIVKRYKSFIAFP